MSSIGTCAARRSAWTRASVRSQRYYLTYDARACTCLTTTPIGLFDSVVLPGYGTPTGAPRPAAAGGAWQGGGGHAGLAAHRGRPLVKGVLPNGPTPGEVLRFAAQRVLPGAEGPERRVDGAVHPGRERGRREQRRGACALWSVCWQRETDSAGVRRFVPVQCTSHDCCVYIAPN